MKVKVLIPFTDKETGKTYAKNDIIDVSAKRFSEIEKPHYIQPVDDAKATTKGN